MRVLYFHQHFALPSGSSGTRSYQFARRLIAEGHEVTMVCGSNVNAGLNLPETPGKSYKEGEIDGIRIIELPLAYSNHDSLPKRSVTFFKFALRSIGIAFREDYDLLFATSTPLTASIPGIVTKPFRRKPFVFEIRDLWPEGPRAMGVITNPFVLWGMTLLERLSYKSADACIGLSPGMVDWVRDRVPDDKPVELIPNGSDTDVFTPGCRSDLQLEGVGAGDFVAVFTGAHGMANGLDAVLSAAAELKKRGRADIKIFFIGDGNQKQALVRRAKEEQLDNCTFRDPVPKTELAKLLPCVDCGLMILDNIPAFYYNTSPNKFFDYISCGIPVLNNYPGWIADMLGEHECGVGVPPKDPKAFADALERLADNPEERKEMGRKARELAEREFERNKLATRFVRFLESVALKRM